MAAHAKLSASGSSRWMNCPGSIAAEANFDEKRSAYSLYGTAAHAVAEKCFANHTAALAYHGWYYIDGIGVCSPDQVAAMNPALQEQAIEVDWEMVDGVQKYLDYVNAIPGTRMIERRVDFSNFVPEGFGTADCIIVGEEALHVIDLKFGKGVQVDAEENSQGMLYALGALDELSVIYDDWPSDHPVVITIVQPRINHVSEWKTTVGDLYKWGTAIVAPAARAALDDGAPRVPGEKQCRFCRAAASCLPLSKETATTASEGFGPIEGVMVEVGVVDGDLERLAYLLSKIDTVRAWCNAIEDYAKELMFEQHVEVPGFKIVEGRGSRAWSDPVAAEKAMKRTIGAAEVYEKKLISPAQAEKKLGKGHYIITKYVSKKPGSPTIVPVSDKRAAITLNHAVSFAPVEE